MFRKLKEKIRRQKLIEVEVLGLTAFGYVVDVDIDACVGLVR